MGHAGSPKRSIIPEDMSAFPKAGSVALNHAVEALAWAAPARRDQVTFKRRDVRLLAPFRRLPTFRDGNLFEGHTRNAPKFATTIAPQWYHVPAYYKGTPAWIGGPDDPLRWPEPTERLDFDGEYTPVMARRQREIAPADAWTQVAGLINPTDFSARDHQASEMPLLMGPTKGKNFQDGTITGSFLVTTDAIADPGGLQSVGRVNGKVVWEARADGAYWKWPACSPARRGARHCWPLT